MLGLSKHSNRTDCWGTPAHIKEQYKDWYDPCPFPRPDDFDGLTAEWGDKTFVNPPYSRIGPWAKKARDEWQKGKTVHMLIPARVSTHYFHDFILPHAKIEFIRGKLDFVPLMGQSVGRSGSMLDMIWCKVEHTTT